MIWTYAFAKTAPRAPARADPTGVKGGRAGTDIMVPSYYFSPNLARMIKVTPPAEFSHRES